MTNIRVTRGDLRPTDLKNQLPYRIMVMEEFQDSEGVTRYRYVPQQAKVDEDMKQRILLEISDHGRLGTACRKNGVTMSTIKKHIERDPEFGRAVMEANEAYKDKLISHHQNLVFNGTTRVNYDRNGNIVSEETIYPVRLIELELKKHDEGYRDKKEVNMNVTGGVMVAPAEMSMEDWEKNFARSDDIGDIIEGTLTDVTEDMDEQQQED